MRFVVFLMVACFALAGEIMSVVAVVNGEPITSYEIEQAKMEQNISASQALEALIDVRLQEAHIKELGLMVDDYELKDRMKLIAKQNNLELVDFEEILTNRGIDLNSYKEDLKKTMLNEKLAQMVLKDEVFPVTDAQIERVYRQKDRFMIPREIVVLQYVANSQSALQRAVENPLVKQDGVSISEQTLKSVNLNPRLLALLVESREGSFAPAFSYGDKEIALFIKEKRGKMKQQLADVRGIIVSELRKESEERAVSNYLSRSRAKANISILRDIR